ncbi:hypothetical protein NMG60_11012644 [Bertholletia excelsa]
MESPLDGRVCFARQLSQIPEVTIAVKYRHDNSICPKKCFLGLSCVSVTNGPFIDGRTTGIEPARGGFTIHCLDPLGYIRPYPRTGETKLQLFFLSLAKLQTKRLGAVHFIDLTSLYLRLKKGSGGSEGSLRKPLRASLLYRVPNLRTPKLQALFEAPT